MRLLKLSLALTLIIMAITAIAQSEKVEALSISGYGLESAGVTATGESFNGAGFSCACYPLYPFGSLVEVCYTPNDSCVTVRTNDSSGSYDTFDVSQDAAEALGIWGTVGRCWVGTDCTAAVVG